MATIEWDEPVQQKYSSVTWDDPPKPRKPDALDQSFDPTIGTSGAQKFLAGMGKSVADTGRGLGQIVGLTSQQDIDDAKARDKALMATGAGTFGNIAGEIVKYAPALALSGVALPAAAIGGIAGLTTGGSLGERGKEAAIQGGAALALGGAAKLLGAGANKVGRMGSLDTSRRIATDVVGNVDEAVPLLRAAEKAGISSDQALAEMNRPAVAALSNIVKGVNSQMSAEAAQMAARQEAARMAAIKGVTPDLAAARAAREAASEPWYDIAKESAANIDRPFMDLFSRLPKGTMEAAENIARMEGKPFMVGKFAPELKGLPSQFPRILEGDPLLGKSFVPATEGAAAQYQRMTGDSLHYIKRALSDISNMADPAKGIGRDSQKAARGVLTDFLEQFETKIPQYRMGRQNFADMSRPVNQSEVLQAMTAKLQSPQGGERASAFLNAMGDGEKALLKKSTGYPRYESGQLKDLLSPKQNAVVDDIAAQLRRDAAVASQASAPGARSSALTAINENTLTQRIPNLLNPKVAIANKAIGEAEASLSKKVMLDLSDAMQNPKRLADLLETAPVEQRNLMLKIINGVNNRNGVDIGAAWTVDSLKNLKR